MAALALLWVAGCSGSPARHLLSEVEDQPYTTERFGVCKDYGCSALVMTGFSNREWARVEAVFAVPAPDAATERARIAEAIGVIEQLVGPKTGTRDDAPGAAVVNFDRHGQMDCIDEAFNTTIYLRLLAGAGLLRWHEVGEPVRRGYVIDRWPHNTATVREQATGDVYVIDSWFHGNGNAAEVVALALWLDGWHPEQTRPPVKP